MRVAFPSALYKGHLVALTENSGKAAKEEGGWHCLILLLVSDAKVLSSTMKRQKVMHKV